MPRPAGDRARFPAPVRPFGRAGALAFFATIALAGRSAGAQELPEGGGAGSVCSTLVPAWNPAMGAVDASGELVGLLFNPFITGAIALVVLGVTFGRIWLSLLGSLPLVLVGFEAASDAGRLARDPNAPGMETVRAAVEEGCRSGSLLPGIVLLAIAFGGLALCALSARRRTGRSA